MKNSDGITAELLTTTPAKQPATKIEASVRKRKRVAKTIQFEEHVWKALEEHKKRERIYNTSMAANDAIKYALFPEHRNDRDADTTKLLNQILYSFNEHRKKTARDLTILQEIIVRFAHTYFMHTHQIPETSRESAEIQANLRLDILMEQIARNLPHMKIAPDADST